MKKYILFFISFTLFVSTGFSQTAAEKYSQAMNAFNNKHYVEANKLFEEFFAEYKLMDELNATAKYYSAESMLNIGENEAAASNFEYLIDNFKWTNFRDKSLYKLGLIYFDLNRYSDSRNTFIKLLDEYPNSEHAGSSMYWVGESFTKEGKPEEAISFLEDAVKKGKNNKYIDYSIYTLASLYEKTGDYQNAVKYYDQLLSYYKDSPLAPSAQIRIGICYFKLKDYQSSILELNNPQL
ncbi:MAG: tetratricopeptide repeat protein, partial [Ignavibacteriaceae bacterium]